VRIALAAAAALLLLAGTACGERQEPTGALAEGYPVTVQGGGDRATVVKSAPQRIVPVGAGPRQILRSLGLGRRIVAVNDTLVGLPLVDAIHKAKPDLIVASSGTDPLDLARARAATKAQVYVEPSSSLDDAVQAIGEIGLLTGTPIEARHLTAAIQAKRRSVAAKLVGAKVASVFVDDGDLSTVSSRSLLGDLVTEAHGRSVAGASPAQGPFPLQRLRQLDPDFYLATAGSGRTLKQLRSQAGTRGLRAVKAGHFAVLPPEASVAGPAVGTALVEIARILHP
jgi:ABC-type Fe3+-hydroxamate transport system substrate-binding protein